MTNPSLPCLLAVVGFALVGCGKSQDARKIEAVRCHGFLTAMLPSLQDLEHPSPFVEAYGRVAKDRLKGQEENINGVEALGEQLSGQLDAVKSAAALQDGSQAYAGFQKANDGNGAVGFVEECIANRDKLLAAAR